MLDVTAPTEILSGVDNSDIIEYTITRDRDSISFTGEIIIQGTNLGYEEDDQITVGINGTTYPAVVRNAAEDAQPGGWITALRISGLASDNMELRPPKPICWVGMNYRDWELFKQGMGWNLPNELSLYIPRVAITTDYWGRGGHSAHSIIRECAQEMGLNVICAFPDYWVKAYSMKPNQKYIDVIADLASCYQPNFSFINSTMIIESPDGYSSLTYGNATYMSLKEEEGVEFVHQEKGDNNDIAGVHIESVHSDGPFDPDRVEDQVVTTDMQTFQFDRSDWPFLDHDVYVYWWGEGYEAEELLGQTLSADGTANFKQRELNLWMLNIYGHRMAEPFVTYTVTYKPIDWVEIDSPVDSADTTEISGIAEAYKTNETWTIRKFQGTHWMHKEPRILEEHVFEKSRYCGAAVMDQTSVGFNGRVYPDHTDATSTFSISPLLEQGYGWSKYSYLKYKYNETDGMLEGILSKTYHPLVIDVSEYRQETARKGVDREYTYAQLRSMLASNDNTSTLRALQLNAASKEDISKTQFTVIWDIFSIDAYQYSKAGPNSIKSVYAGGHYNAQGMWGNKVQSGGLGSQLEPARAFYRPILPRTMPMVRRYSTVTTNTKKDIATPIVNMIDWYDMDVLLYNLLSRKTLSPNVFKTFTLNNVLPIERGMEIDIGAITNGSKEFSSYSVRGNMTVARYTLKHTRKGAQTKIVLDGVKA